MYRVKSSAVCMLKKLPGAEVEDFTCGTNKLDHSNETNFFDFNTTKTKKIGHEAAE